MTSMTSMGETFFNILAGAVLLTVIFALVRWGRTP